ncbi:MAG TPA: flagellar basal-body rod protein FlgF [Caulobacteraceae bacterium]|nr:flagellar basal-body rod protein FlgF [Caulobacteraceae bacterium]
MDNSIYVSLSRQITLQRELDITANNLANVDTTGFKFEELMTSADPAGPAASAGVSGPVIFVASDGVARDFTQGPLTQTGAPLDLAISGQGFFEISTSSGPRYTRDGRFKLDPTGRIVTQDGDPVQGDGGTIVIDPTKGAVSISATGIVSQAGQTVAKLALVSFADLSALSKDGSGLYSNVSNLTPTPAAGALVRQGMLEGSNVEPVVQITRLIEISRAYEAVTNLINATSALSKTAIQQLGQPSAGG